MNPAMKHTNNTTMAGRTGKPVPYERAGVGAHNRVAQPGWRLWVYDPRTDRQPEKNFSGTYEQAAVELER